MMRKKNMWVILSFIFISLIILPTLNVFTYLLKKPNENWDHIKEYLLYDYIFNSMKLIFFVGIFTIIIGTSLAWIISVYDFPGRRIFRWILILPLVIPPYIAAYTYHGILNYTGVIQTNLRNNYNIYVEQKYFNIMSSNGAIFIFTMVLFPYIYIIVKSFLEKQSASLIENARVLGSNSFEVFVKVAIPISRTAIVGGASLVILEVLNDYGVVKYFGIPTFSTAIFKTWFAMGDVDSAVRLASLLMLTIFGILTLEMLLRGKKKYSYTTSKIRPITLVKLQGINGVMASLYCSIIFSFSFLIPTIQLISWSILTYKKVLNVKFMKLVFNSFFVALITAVLIVVIAVIISNHNRIQDNIISKIYSKITIIGYSIPGAVIAISVIVFFIGIDKKMYWFYKLIDENSIKLVLSTSIVMLIFAYVIRFLAIGFNPIEAGFEKTGKKFFEASRTLGMGITETFMKVDLHMIKPAIVSAFILVFVDVLKELPLTLILRPFNFNTLATKSFEYASDEMIHEAAVPSLIIIIISCISIYLFYKAEKREV